MDLRGEALKKEIDSLGRTTIINWLQWNDRNGIYKDADSLREFGNVLSKEEAAEIMFRQIMEC